MGGKLCKGRGFSPDDINSQYEYLKSRFKLSDERIMEYRTLFMEFSVDKKVIQRDDFRKVYQIVYKNEEASSFADRVFDAFDTNKGGTVDFVEFAVGLTMTDSKQIDQKISIAFHMYDEDGNNALSKEEVIDMIQAYYKLLGPHFQVSSTDIANNLFDKMDLNKDKKVTFEEFTQAAKSDPKVLEILDPQA